MLRPLRRFGSVRARVAALVLCGLLYHVPGVVAAQDAGTASSANTTTFQLSGVVIDSTRAPVPEAEVTLIEGGAVQRQVVTDAAGRFTLGDFPAGRRSVHVRRLGYEQRTVDVLVGVGGQPTFVEIIVAAVPAELQEVLVNPTARGRLREFYERKRQRHAFARFLEQAEIQQLAPTNSSDLFRSVPGITIRATSGGGNTIRIRGCQPLVWVDGQPIPGAELDAVIQPPDIGAIEFYPSSAGIPAQYMERSNRLCGLILVWTRNQ